MDQGKPQQAQQQVSVPPTTSSASHLEAPRRPKSLLSVTDEFAARTAQHDSSGPTQPVPASPTSVETPTAGSVCVALSPREPSTKLASVQPCLSVKVNSAMPPMEHAGAMTRNKVNDQNFATLANRTLNVTPCTQIGSATPQTRTTSFKTGGAASPKEAKTNTGRWTDAEHKLFLKGLETFPYRAWKKIATLIKTRTVVQIRTHAQKYYQKLEKEEARMKDREAQMAMQQGFSVRASVDQSMCAYGSVDGVRGGSMGKKKSGTRKRKTFSEDSNNAPSKRIAREKRLVRDNCLSQKENSISSAASVKLFPGPISKGPTNSNPSIQAPILPMPPIMASSATPGVPASSRAALPIDLEDHDSILDLVEDKQLPVTEYAMALEGIGDHDISPLDSEDLLQLTDDESLDWFTDDLSSDESCSGSPLPSSSSASSSSWSSAVQCLSPASSPLTLGRIHFSPEYECGLEDFDELEACGSASPIGSDATAILNCEDDEDIVLDPEKFLSTYLDPTLPMDQW